MCIKHVLVKYRLRYMTCMMTNSGIAVKYFQEKYSSAHSENLESKLYLWCQILTMSVLLAQAPEEISSSTTCVWPCCAAICKGVLSTYQKIIMIYLVFKFLWSIVWYFRQFNNGVTQWWDLNTTNCWNQQYM